ncbi:SufD family Fe-S cluster assembly protein [Patescibacteria group bacterium]|nr:SufD family Fe-S cluster assembly protein [Patescibacteria group bacterium]MCL5797287.1 SufD family Fe-S cluster assembly protein [Patescibacteria group bacterium]
MKKNSIVIIDKLRKNQQFIVDDERQKTFFILLDCGKDESGDVNINIKSESANVQILGIVLGYGKQKIEMSTLQKHLKPKGVSDLFIKSVLFDESKFYYRGLIKIEKDAQKSNAYQKNQTLLMSRRSWADTRPYLEILANDVRCTHGATVGKLDENQLYYLSTRGIERGMATKLLISGFLQDVVDRIPQEDVRKRVEGKIEQKVNQLLNKSVKD